jgi:hypothetical protein
MTGLLRCLKDSSDRLGWGGVIALPRLRNQAHGSSIQVGVLGSTLRSQSSSSGDVKFLRTLTRSTDTWAWSATGL